MIPAILESLRRDVVVFDYWICNMDRYLGEHGGNPNLFWEPQSEQLVVIDHNQAFDADFSLSEFASTHVFRGDLHQVFSDSAMQQGYQQRLRLALSRWGEICDTVPAEWWWFDDEETIPADFNRDQAYRCLSRIDEEGFWRLP
jgi:hypothetical protein